MPERAHSSSLLLAAGLLLLGAIAHALTGPTFVRQALGTSAGDPEAVAVLRVGWQLGSVSLGAFGFLVLAAGLARWRGEPVSALPLRVVATTLIGFGAGALMLASHAYFYFYLGYLILGGLVAFGASPSGQVAAGKPVLRVAAEPAD